MIKNRTLSLAVIIVVYVIAAFGGILAYNYFRKSFSVEAALLLADVAATALVFLFSLIFGNASVYDPYWSVQPPVILAVALYKCIPAGSDRLLGWLLFAVVLFCVLLQTGLTILKALSIRIGAMLCSRKRPAALIRLLTF